VYTIGPYNFTETDARRTVELFDDLWGFLEDGRDAAVIAQLRPVLTGDVADDIEVVWQALQAAGPALRAADELPSTVHGTVDQLSLSGGGVPKLPAPTVDVDYSGVVGDKQNSRQHHGRPWQALCVWSTEVIAAFAADGHPIAAGRAGENITVSGLPWADVRPGVRLCIGSVVCDVSSYALPCKHNAPWFIDGNFRLMHHERGPVSRLYATVLQPGRISVGDDAVLEP
jgi:hypothetical protein